MKRAEVDHSKAPPLQLESPSFLLSHLTSATLDSHLLRINVCANSTQQDAHFCRGATNYHLKQSITPKTNRGKPPPPPPPKAVALFNIAISAAQYTQGDSILEQVLQQQPQQQMMIKMLLKSVCNSITHRQTCK